MSSSLWKRAGAVIGSLTLGAGAATAQTRLVRAAAPPSAAIQSFAARGALRAQRVAVDLSALPRQSTSVFLAQDLRIELFYGRVVNARLDRVVPAARGASYVGTLDGGGTIVAARAGDAFVADLALDDARYEIRFDGRDHVLTRRDPAATPACGVADSAAAQARLRTRPRLPRGLVVRRR